MTLGDVLGSIRRHVRLIVAIAGLCAIGVVAFLAIREEVRPEARYRAEVDLLIPAIKEDEEGARTPPAGVPPVLLQGQIELALRPEAVEAASAAAVDAGGDAPDLAVDASLNDSADTLTLSATVDTPEAAVAAADALASSFVSARRETAARGSISGQGSARRAIEAFEARVDEIEQELSDLGIEPPAVVAEEQPSGETDSPSSPVVDVPVPRGASSEAALLIYERNALVNSIAQTRANYGRLVTQALNPRSFADVVQRRPAVETTPEPPTPLIPIGVGVGAAVLLAVAVPVLLDRLDSSVRTAKAASIALGAPLLATVPPASRSEAQALAAPGSSRSSAFRFLATASVASDALPRAITVTTPRGSRQDDVAANFAAALASLGLTVVLVATDDRQAWFGEVVAPFGEGASLTDLLDLARRGHLGEVLAKAAASLPSPGLTVVAPGAPDDPREHALDGLPPLLEAFGESKVDIVVIAGPAVLEDPDGTIFAWATGAVLWAVGLGQLHGHDAEDAAALLGLARVTPFGVAVVGRDD